MGFPAVRWRQLSCRLMRTRGTRARPHVFAGPFDLLLTLILREEVDLLEVDLAEIVISYIDHLELRGQLELESATEFLVLIASLLELKSRLLLPGEERGDRARPGRGRRGAARAAARCPPLPSAAAHVAARLAAQSGYRFRSAPLPPAAGLDARATRRGLSAGRLAAAIESCCSSCARRRSAHAGPEGHGRRAARASAHAPGRGRFSFDDAVASADRVTVAVTLFAVLELYKQGELTWTQEQPFAEIRIEPGARAVRARRRGAALGAEAVRASSLSRRSSRCCS